MPVPLRVDVQVTVDDADVPSEAVIREWLERVIERMDKDSDRELEISVMIVDEAESRDLNRRYRDKDKATNVLSFPAVEPALNNPPAELPRALGDIVICGPVVAREARAAGKQNADHWAHLLVHGALHLLGYDHESEPDAKAMEAVEAAILAAGGVENPYRSRI